MKKVGDFNFFMLALAGGIYSRGTLEVFCVS